MVANLTLSIRFPVDSLELSGQPVSMAWQGIRRRVERLRDLTADWDGNGATPPKPEIIDAAGHWVEQMPQLHPDAIPPTQVTAGSLGEVLLIWQSDSQLIEADLGEPDSVEWTVKVGDADPEFFSIPIVDRA